MNRSGVGHHTQGCLQVDRVKDRVNPGPSQDLHTILPPLICHDVLQMVYNTTHLTEQDPDQDVTGVKSHQHVI